MKYNEILAQVKKDSIGLANTSNELRNEALKNIKAALFKNKEYIFEANKKDIASADENGISEHIKARLKFDISKLEVCLDGIDQLISLNDPLNIVQMKRELDKDLVLTKYTVPIGVIGVIFEARPDALIQIACLCLKSGNASLLKGGSETKNTNRAIFDVIHKAGVECGISSSFATLLEDRESVESILAFDKYIDLIIPRGSNEFVQHIMSNSKIPVMGHADGICHTYIDKEADIDMAARIINDAKMQYPVACNALETLIVHEDVYDDIVPKIDPQITINYDAYGVEYLNFNLSLIKVSSIDEAIEHINKYGSHHTDVIVTDNEDSATYFINRIDSAGVYHNCSSRFADGFRYGFGAEVGISTGKLHARGPVGLEGLVTYKYKLQGKGQIVGDYASGKSQFNYIDLDKK